MGAINHRIRFKFMVLWGRCVQILRVQWDDRPGQSRSGAKGPEGPEMEPFGAAGIRCRAPNPLGCRPQLLVRIRSRSDRLDGFREGRVEILGVIEVVGEIAMLRQ